MADNKKRDDLVIDLDEKRGYDQPSRSPMSPRTPMTPAPSGPAMPSGAVANNPIVPILSYCVSSIMMTVTNKFVLSGTGFNLNFFLLCVQVSRTYVQYQWDWMLTVASLLFVWLQFRPAKPLGSYNIETSTQMKLENVSQYYQLGMPAIDSFKGSQSPSPSLS